jgi:hypothetical protein
MSQRDFEKCFFLTNANLGLHIQANRNQLNYIIKFRKRTKHFTY